MPILKHSDDWLLFANKGMMQCDQMDRSENTHLLSKGKYNYTADLLFDWLGFGQTSKYVVN